MSDGVTIGSQEALDEAGWKPLRLEAKEGLALINGTAQMAGRGSLITERIRRLLEKTEIVTAAMLEAFRGSMDPFDPACMPFAPIKVRSPPRHAFDPLLMGRNGERGTL